MQKACEAFTYFRVVLVHDRDRSTTKMVRFLFLISAPLAAWFTPDSAPSSVAFSKQTHAHFFRRRHFRFGKKNPRLLLAAAACIPYGAVCSLTVVVRSSRFQLRHIDNIIGRHIIVHTEARQYVT